ncbi:DUF544 family protein [Cavenderia fasciculata]|uniref:DUF544 family protein n=1 Tax=Cavenderia fasciculata TaxID=261658 RepID=F4QD77_CACFS|nr:DUF544 family protein [Cavenderia fasciculata]EGG14548.1 DUF544 family protein [Cavenderia fasciculata]|eukprot:XP_004366068.1 DUF544 family protein [Cavenderia fasciculata]
MGKVKYMTSSGTEEEFDTSDEACEKFGFYPGSRVITPKGRGSVIGVREGNIWFHIDKDKGASYWDNATDYEALLFKLNFRIDESEDGIADIGAKYRVKRITYRGREVKIVLQNENGPCPLISIGNVLLLQEKIVIDSDSNLISLKRLGDLIIGHAKLLYAEEPDILPIIDDYEKTVLPSLETGLIVNINFNSISGFEKTVPCQIFDYLNIKLVHGWISDPKNTEAHNLIGSLTYNELAPKIVTFEQSFPNANLGTEAQIRELINCHQLTDYGLELIRSNLQDDELCVFFRNNHFATMTKHEGNLHILVSDVGYETERAIVWEKIVSIGGENLFLSGDFKTRKESALEEVRLNLLAIGYKESEVKEAMDFVISSNDANVEPFDIATSFMNSKQYVPT